MLNSLQGCPGWLRFLPWFVLCLIRHRYHFSCLQQRFSPADISLWYPRKVFFIVVIYPRWQFGLGSILIAQLFCLLQSLPCFSTHHTMQLFSFHVSPLQSLKHHDLSVTLIHFICCSHCVWSQIYISQSIRVLRVWQQINALEISALAAIEGKQSAQNTANQKQVAVLRFFIWPLDCHAFLSGGFCVCFSFPESICPVFLRARLVWMPNQCLHLLSWAFHQPLFACPG